MTVVTGVSGSGKSTLINQTLYPILFNQLNKGKLYPLEYKSIKGLEKLEKVINIDQSPIGRTPRSNPATYTKIFDEDRKSTRLNSSHANISYAVFCLKKKKQNY